MVIILIGPIGAGKSTQGQLLSERLRLPRRAMDDVRFDYYKEIGWTEADQDAAGRRGGFKAVYAYWKPFELHAVERILSDAADRVIDFGAGHSVFEDEAMLARAERALAPFPHVVLLLPSPDDDESVRLLRERTGPVESNGMDFHDHFVRHPSNRRLAKHVVYTAGRTPEETRDEIVALVGARPAAAVAGGA